MLRKNILVCIYSVGIHKYQLYVMNCQNTKYSKCKLKYPVISPIDGIG